MYYNIALGSNCSITWQLKKYNLRLETYPFDWCKISLKQLINVLENKFKDFENIEIKKYSNNHESYLITNKYNIKFAHEVITNNINNFKNKLINRINKFNNLENICFIYIELQPIKNTFEQNVLILNDLLKNYARSFIIKIIIPKTNYTFDFPDNIFIYNYDTFSQDWKRDDIEWSSIL